MTSSKARTLTAATTLKHFQSRFLDSHIDHDVAKRYVKRFRDNNPNYPLKTIWLDGSVANKIHELLNNNIPVSGIKVYFAQHDDDNFTLVVGLTREDTIDYPDYYFNLGKPCPPEDGCGGDIIDHPEQQ